MGVDQIWRVNNWARDENEVAKHMCAKVEGKHLLNKGAPNHVIVGRKGIHSQQCGLDEKCPHRLKNLYI